MYSYTLLVASHHWHLGFERLTASYNIFSILFLSWIVCNGMNELHLTWLFCWERIFKSIQFFSQIFLSILILVLKITHTTFFLVHFCVYLENLLTSFNQCWINERLYFFFQVVPTYSHTFPHICQLFTNGLIWNVSFCLKKEKSLRYHIPKCLDYNSALMQIGKYPESNTMMW